MRRVDFVISNDGHHASMFEPVIGTLAARGDLDVRLVSLCEFRGLSTPAELFAPHGIQVQRILRSRFRRSSTGSRSGSPASGLARRVARRLSWSLLLKPALVRWAQTRPDLVVIPNDAAFPYNLICEVVSDRGIPFVLVQEGIRFPLPNDEGDDYGRNGAIAIAAWGANSADFFRRQGVLEERIHITGSPRFDSVLKADWASEAAQLRKEFGLGRRVLLFLTNPIDDQGFCTTEQKMALVGAFLNDLKPLFEDPEFCVVVKLHGRESEQDYRELRDRFSYAEKIHIFRSVGLYPLFSLAQASVVFASTAGLESLLLGCPLGVLEIPGFGFVHDYVSSGVAEGLGWNDRMAEGIERLLQPDAARNEHATAYVHRNLACLGSSGRRVQDLVLEELQRWVELR